MTAMRSPPTMCHSYTLYWWRFKLAKAAAKVAAKQERRDRDEHTEAVLIWLPCLRLDGFRIFHACSEAQFRQVHYVSAIGLCKGKTA